VIFLVRIVFLSWRQETIVDDKFKSVEVHPSEITPKTLYLSRRDFLKAMGMVTAGSLLAACAPRLPAVTASPEAPAAATEVPTASGQTDELGDPLNTYEQITNYNNYYEFSTSKEAVAPISKNFKTSPWAVQVYGLVNNPKTYAVEDLIKKFPPEERIYRLRASNKHWNGFPRHNIPEIRTLVSKTTRSGTVMPRAECRLLIAAVPARSGCSSLCRAWHRWLERACRHNTSIPPIRPFQG